MLAFSMFLWTSCGQSKAVKSGALIGAGVGGLTKGWKGAGWGALLGAGLGGVYDLTTEEMARRSAERTAETGRPYAYEAEEGDERIETEFYAKDPNDPGCDIVKVTLKRDGRVQKEYFEKVCR